jgi:hypothetical protein
MGGEAGAGWGVADCVAMGRAYLSGEVLEIRSPGLKIESIHPSFASCAKANGLHGSFFSLGSSLPTISQPGGGGGIGLAAGLFFVVVFFFMAFSV